MDKHIIITIGREFGSGGKSIASLLSERLGIPVYDNELITKAAEKSGLSATVFRESDEKRSFLGLGNILGSLRFGDFGRNMLNDGELFRIQSETIRDLAASGDAIFVGRASDYVLRDMKTFDIFIFAPRQVRARTVAARKGISEEEAAELVLKQDKTRRDYYNLFTLGDNWGVASNYDLCLDSSIIGYEAAADYIISFGRQGGLI